MNYGEMFSGIGVGSLAIEKVFGKKAKCAFFSEIQTQRINSYLKNFPGHNNIGNIDFVEIDKLPKIDLLIGGSPCQDLSIARGKREGLDGDQSGLFFKFLDVVREKKPKYFILENVASMKDEDRDHISKCLGVQPIMISSIYYTGQDRCRYYWCNFPVAEWSREEIDPRLCIDKTDIPEKHVSEFIKLEELHSAYKISRGEVIKMKNPKSYIKDSCDWDIVAWSRSTRYKEFDTDEEMTEFIQQKNITNFKYMIAKKKPIGISYVEQRIKINMKAHTLVTGKHCQRMSAKNFVRHKSKMRPLNTKECLRFQGLPDNFLDGLSDSAIYSAVGDSFTLGPIVHILTSLKEVISNEKSSN